MSFCINTPIGPQPILTSVAKDIYNAINNIVTLKANGAAISGYDFSGYITIDGSSLYGTGRGLGNFGSSIKFGDVNGTYAWMHSHFANGLQQSVFTFTGFIKCNVLIQTSDANTKTNIVTLVNALDIVCQLRGVSYTNLTDNSDSVGVIAQEVELLIPQVVTTDQDGLKGVAYTNLIGYLIESIKELNTKVENLTNRITELESK